MASLGLNELNKTPDAKICHHSPLLCEIIDPGLVILLAYRHCDKSLEHAHILGCKWDGDVYSRLGSQPHTLVMAQQEAEGGRLVDYNFRLLTHGSVKLLVWFCSEKNRRIKLQYTNKVTSHLNRTWHPGSHCWNYYLCTLSCSQASATHWKIGHP